MSVVIMYCCTFFAKLGWPHKCTRAGARTRVRMAFGTLQRFSSVHPCRK